MSSIIHTLRVGSLRKSRVSTLPGTQLHTSARPRRMLHAAVVSITVIRVPIALVGLISIALSMPLPAVASFMLFALLDLIDGMAARRIGIDTALRRIGDVLIDRVTIHLAALIVCTVFDSGWTIWATLLIRDVIQGVCSSVVAIRRRIIVVGATWHMAYGLAVLAWGCAFVLTGHSDEYMSIVVIAVAFATFLDYAVKSHRLVGRRV